MSTLVDAEIVNAIVLAAVLEADLGSHRKITRFRILRPMLLAVAIVPLFIEKVATHGGGLTIELAGVAAGLAGGVLALLLLRVYRSEKTGKPVSAAGGGYALLWAVVIGARALFSYCASHWFEHQLGDWLTANSIPPAAITDGLIFMAVAMVLTRALGLARRARSIPVGRPAMISRPDYTRA
jgi:membrane protease YdiL (CAAX protease family)